MRDVNGTPKGFALMMEESEYASVGVNRVYGPWALGLKEMIQGKQC